MLENTTESSKITRHCKIYNTKFQISRETLKESPTPLNTFCNSCYLESINSPEIDKPSPKKKEGEKKLSPDNKSILDTHKNNSKNTSVSVEDSDGKKIFKVSHKLLKIN